MTAQLVQAGLRATNKIGRPESPYSDEVVRLARLYHLRGWSPAEVYVHLRAKGHEVPPATLEGWLYGKTRRDAGWPTGRTIQI